MKRSAVGVIVNLEKKTECVNRQHRPHALTSDRAGRGRPNRATASLARPEFADASVLAGEGNSTQHGRLIFWVVLRRLVSAGEFDEEAFGMLSRTGKIGRRYATLIALGILATMVTPVPAYGATLSQTFNCTGGVQTWTVPIGVTWVDVLVRGAQGGVIKEAWKNYGGGGRARGRLPVTPGETLTIRVGCQPSGRLGGFNGGAAGSTGSTADGRGGGGASDIRQGGTTLASRVIVAGGGGGASPGWSDCAGGEGGGLSGLRQSWAPGPNGCTFGGEGGTQTAGGAGGVGWNCPCVDGSPGTWGAGGAGASKSGPYGAGGGGGGYYGGGGGAKFDVSTSGAGGSGGGGSGYIDPVVEALGGVVGSHQTGVNLGHGSITIGWLGAEPGDPEVPDLPGLESGYPSDHCYTATGTTNVVDGYVSDLYLRLGTAPDPNSDATWVCAAYDDGANHAGGKVTVGGSPGGVPTVVREDSPTNQWSATCIADANNERVDSGNVLGEPWWLDVTPFPAGDQAALWVCVRFTNSIGYRLEVPLVGGATFLADTVQPHPSYSGPSWPSGKPSTACRNAATGLRLVDVRVGSDPVGLYAWPESASRTHVCVRGGGEGGRATVDTSASIGVSPLLTTSTTDLSPCAFEVFTKTDEPSFGIFTHAHPTSPAFTTPPISACATVGGNTAGVRATIGANQSATVQWHAD